MTKKEQEEEQNHENWVPVHDSIGLTHWLPPICRNCDD
jgi:hypothetical protein